MTGPGPAGHGRLQRYALAFVAVALACGAAGYATTAGRASSGPLVVAGALAGPPIPVGSAPDDIVAGDGFVWTANADSASISRVDPVVGTSAEIPVPGLPHELVVGDGSAWVVNYNNAVTRVDLATGRSGPPIRTGGAPIADLVLGAGFLWASHPADGTIGRISLESGLPDGDPIAVGGEPSSMAFVGHVLYVADVATQAVLRIDGPSNQVLAPVPLGRTPGGIETADGTIYVGVTDAVIPIDEQTMVTGDPLPIPGARLYEIALGSLWAVYPTENVVRRFDLDSGQENGAFISGVGVGTSHSEFTNGQLWLVQPDTGSVVRITPRQG